MSIIQDPAGYGAANIVDAVSPSFTGGKALSVAVSNASPPLVASVVLAGALNAVQAIPVQGRASVGIVISGTWVGTISFQASVDGSTWVTDAVFDLASQTFITATTSNRTVTAAIGAYAYYRVTFSAWTSGTATIAYFVSPATGAQEPTLLSDSGNNGPVAVKPASTAAVAADPALVVALSPNQGLTLGADRTATGTITANGQSVLLSTQGSSITAFQLTGTWTGTIVFEETHDGGTTWNACEAYTTKGEVSLGASTTVNVAGLIRTAGFQQLRLRSTAWTSGTAVVSLAASAGCVLIAASQGDGGGPTAPWGVGISDGTNGYAAVKPASSAAVAADPALAVTMSPNSAVLSVNTPARQRVSIVFQAVATATADTLLSLVKSTNGVAAAGATTIPVAGGKTLRIQSMTFSVKAGAAAAAFATWTLRINPAGAALISSQSEFRVDVGNTEAVIGAARAINVVLPAGGFELTGAAQLAVSLACQATTNIISVSLNGYEY